MKNFSSNFGRFAPLSIPLAMLLVIGLSAAMLMCGPKAKPPDANQNVASPTGASSTSVKYSCVAGPGEQCASDLWYADYVRMKALQKQYEVPMDIQDRITGMAARLGQQVPPGYYWDDAKSRFVKQNIPVPPPPVTPVPAPAVRKK